MALSVPATADILTPAARKRPPVKILEIPGYAEYPVDSSPPDVPRSRILRDTWELE